MKPDSSPILSIIIVSYNVSEALQRCLSRLKPLYDAGLAEFVVIDNDSSDDSAARVSDMGWPRLIVNEHNTGFAAAVNQGVEAGKRPYILLLNPDTSASPESIEDMLTFITDHERCGAVGPQLLNADHSTQMSHHDFPTPRSFLAESFFMKTGKPVVPTDNPHHVDAVVGACMMIRRAAFEEVGPFDDRFFLYSEEVDWCLRAGQAGWMTCLLPQIHVTHGLAQSSRDNPGRAFVELYRSRHLFMDKHFSRSGAVITRLGLFAGVLLRVLFWGAARFIIRDGEKRKTARHKFKQNKAVWSWYVTGCPNPHLK